MAIAGTEKFLSYRFGFVMEQNLGHRTHYRNLLRYVREDPAVAPTWMPIGFDTPGFAANLPLVRRNWSVRASLLAWRAVGLARRQTTLDALFYHTQVTALLSPLHADLPTVISLDATPMNYDSVGRLYGHRADGKLEALKWWVNRRALARAAALVTWCAWAKDSLVRDYGISGDRVTVIPPGVDLARWPRRTGSERVVSSAGRLPRLLFVGGDFARKGGEVLLQCFRGGLDERCELHVVTQSAVAPARNLYVYPNVTPNSDTLLRLYADADLFIFPTLADCAPLAVPEAMAAALPVVCTHVGAIPEMVGDGKTGLLVPAGDVGALRAAIETLLDRPELRGHMGDAGRQVVEVDYDARYNCLRLLDVLKGATDRAHQWSTPAARHSGEVARLPVGR
jgi:glycosyltransferase involved in cell wall biosynthesis